MKKKLISNNYIFFKLYEALHVGEYQIRRERELHERLELLNSKLGPLETVSFIAI